MNVAGLVLGIAAIVVAVLLTFTIEWLKRPRIDIRPSFWRPPGPQPHTFATVEVYNRPLPALLQRALVRASAQSCQVSLEFREHRDGNPAIPVVRARWSEQPEPFRQVVLVDSQGGRSVSRELDDTLLAASLKLDIPAGESGHEVALAIMLGDASRTAYAWGADSYKFNGLNPTWLLQRKMYEVSVKLQGSGVAASKRFRLDNLAPDFGTFGNVVEIDH